MQTGICWMVTSLYQGLFHFIYFWPCHVAVRSEFPQQGQSPCRLQEKYGVLTMDDQGIPYQPCLVGSPHMAEQTQKMEKLLMTQFEHLDKAIPEVDIYFFF